MYLVPLNQIESVELVIHALRAAGGQADCDMCPVRKVCTKQCLTIADAIAKMARDGTLPGLELDIDEKPPEPPETAPPAGGGKGNLKVVK
ncbi:MAG: hypothetical protein C0623_04290 [Desulfuromonas sp.]|nr:MAG: hypothetical protein C0623_04290 [Desulfuromonas sp.]